MSRALVVGGTGPTGPHVVNGLIERGYTVSILHTGAHESPQIPASVKHIHTDPFDIEKVKVALEGSNYDLVVVMYGRLRELAQLLVGRAGQFVSVGGVPAYTGWGDADALWPAGMRVPTRETSRLVVNEGPEFPVNRKVANIGRTEVAVFESHPTASHLRYPWIYGPGQVASLEHSIVRRVLDGRKHLILPDGGMSLQSRAYSINAAHLLLTIVDNPKIAAGEVYNASDEWTPTLLQWAEIIASALGHQFEIVSMPWEYATLAQRLTVRGTPHHRVTSCEKAMFELGYRDLVDPVDGLAVTARHLAEHPLEPGGPEERSLSDLFDYDGEDRLIEVWADAMQDVSKVAVDVDAGTPDRYSASFDDSKRTGWTTVKK
ncbi:MAG: epimerase [Acidimicrobiaceae bacterium]|nr:epimerase [Acidimicrobiaceae bacterium]|tara:strand:- start:30516 stop:31640 length:1125 start_codon:yes stop_codon:yes gene_type:complete